ncbi:MAG: hypothetical protein JSV92_02805 [archaeon]|nr:MAG: hypothetical protein JSV92_02805 [archaeon]
MNLDPLTLGDVFASLILIIASLINWKIFRMYYKGGVKPTGRSYFVLGLLLFALLHEGAEVFAGLTGSIQVLVANRLVYIIYVLIKSVGPVIIFYASLVMYREAKKYVKA